MAQSTAEPEVNYFVCTLGQAATLNAAAPHAFRTVNDLLDVHARRIPEYPAVGFPVPNNDAKHECAAWQQRILSMAM